MESRARRRGAHARVDQAVEAAPASEDTVDEWRCSPVLILGSNFPRIKKPRPKANRRTMVKIIMIMPARCHRPQRRPVQVVLA